MAKKNSKHLKNDVINTFIHFKFENFILDLSEPDICTYIFIINIHLYEFIVPVSIKLLLQS